MSGIIDLIDFFFVGEFELEINQTCAYKVFIGVVSSLISLICFTFENTRSNSRF